MREVHGDATLVKRYVELSELRRFVFDIIDRVEALETAFDRLRELFELYVQIDRKREDLEAAQLQATPGRHEFDLPDHMRLSQDRYHREAVVLVSFAYYELSTLVTLLGEWCHPADDSALRYLVGVRKKILAHPRRDGRIKSSRSALTVVPILHAHLLGAESWNPLVRDWYLNELSLKGVYLDESVGTDACIALLREARPISQHRSKDEISVILLQLKAYVIPEPDLVASANEMGKMLLAGFLPHLERVCTERLI